MRIPSTSPPLTEARPRHVPAPASGDNAAHAASPEPRLPERDAAQRPDLKRLMPTSRLSFDIDPAGHAVTLTLADRSSGEVCLKLVYDRGGLARPLSQARAGRRIDIAT